MEKVKRYHEFDGLWKHILHDMWENIQKIKVPKDGHLRRFVGDMDYNGEPFHIEVVFQYTNDYLIIKDSKIEKVNELFHYKAIN